MEITQQLAVFIENKPGTLARVSAELAREKINILGLATSDSIDHCVLRMVVDRPDVAVAILESRGALVIEQEVILIEGGAHPGDLARLAEKLADHKINIEYAYGAVSPGAKKGLLILRTSDNRKALRAMHQPGK